MQAPSGLGVRDWMGSSKEYVQWLLITPKSSARTNMIESISSNYPNEKEFHQATEQHLQSILPVLEQNKSYRSAAVFECMIEPERIIAFRVPWIDDNGRMNVNRAYRVEMNSAIGPYKGGLRFHPSVNQSIVKFLAFEQVFANAMTTMPLGGAASGTDFDPKGKSNLEIMRFCQNFITELFRHVGVQTDIASADIGVCAREIGYLNGIYKKLTNESNGVLTGGGLGLGSGLIRSKAAGYGCVYFAAEMLATRSQSLAGKACLISGSGKIALAIAEKLIQHGAKVLTLSDSNGFIYDNVGISQSKLEFVKKLKFHRIGRLETYADKYPSARYVKTDPSDRSNSLWRLWADCAFPAATENEIHQTDAYNLINQKIKLVCEGANMPCTTRAITVLQSRKDILYAPAKASNAGGAAVTGLKMSQNSEHLSWRQSKLDQSLKLMMHNIHQSCLDAAERYGHPGSYLVGANITGFTRVADAMLDQGIV